MYSHTMYLQHTQPPLITSTHHLHSPPPLTTSTHHLLSSPPLTTSTHFLLSPPPLITNGTAAKNNDFKIMAGFYEKKGARAQARCLQSTVAFARQDAQEGCTKLITERELEGEDGWWQLRVELHKERGAVGNFGVDMGDLQVKARWVGRRATRQPARRGCWSGVGCTGFACRAASGRARRETAIRSLDCGRAHRAGRAAARERWELEQQEVTPEAGRGGKWKGGQEAGGEGGGRGTGGARELRFGAEEEESDAEEAAQAVLARVMAEAVAEAEREEFAC